MQKFQLKRVLAFALALAALCMACVVGASAEYIPATPEQEALARQYLEETMAVLDSGVYTVKYAADNWSSARSYARCGKQVILQSTNESALARWLGMENQVEVDTPDKSLLIFGKHYFEFPASGFPAYCPLERITIPKDLRVTANGAELKVVAEIDRRISMWYVFTGGKLTRVGTIYDGAAIFDYRIHAILPTADATLASTHGKWKVPGWVVKVLAWFN